MVGPGKSYWQVNMVKVSWQEAWMLTADQFRPKLLRPLPSHGLFQGTPPPIQQDGP